MLSVGSFPGVMRPGSDVDHSPSSNGGVKNEWSCTSSHPIRLLGVDGGSFALDYVIVKDVHLPS
jgi:hypothetical protein